MPITTVFLDLYQTVAYIHPPREERQSRVLSEFGFQVDEAALRRAYLVADHHYSLANADTPIPLRTPEERHQVYTWYQRMVMEQVGLGHATHLAEQLYLRYWQFEREFRPYPDAIPALTWLKGAGYRVGLITNVPNDPAGDLERVGLRPHFDTIVASCLVGVEKPNPLIFQVALERLGVAAEEALHVGDQLAADVQGATSVGMRAVLLDRFDLLDGQHHMRIKSLLELAPLLRNGLP